MEKSNIKMPQLNLVCKNRRSEILSILKNKKIILEKKPESQNILQTTLINKIMTKPHLKMELTNSFLLAIKVTQENLNHNSKGNKYYTENYYGKIDNDFFNVLMNKPELNNALKIICFHYNALGGDIKYSWFKTNYTKTSINLRIWAKNLKLDVTNPNFI